VVEAVARGTGALGRHGRRLQTGLAHQYYVLAGVGLVVVLVVAALGT
jgi:hypothetical protein